MQHRFFFFSQPLPQTSGDVIDLECLAELSISFGDFVHQRQASFFARVAAPLVDVAGAKYESGIEAYRSACVRNGPAGVPPMSGSHGNYQLHRGSPGYQEHPGPPKALGRAGTVSPWRYFFLRHHCRLRILRRFGQLIAHNRPGRKNVSLNVGRGVPGKRAFSLVAYPPEHSPVFRYPNPISPAGCTPICPHLQSMFSTPIGLSCPPCYLASAAKNPISYSSKNQFPIPRLIFALLLG